MIIQWLSAARRDFDAIFEFIEADNPVAAAAQGDQIQEQVGKLAQNQKLGRRGRVKGTRELVIARTPYIAVYRLVGDRIQILRILHGAQQWPPA